MNAIVKAPKDLLAGMIFGLVGAGFLAWSRSYRVGTASEMGPGYFPTVLAILLCLVGVVCIVKGVAAKTPDPLPRHNIVPVVLMVAAVASFGLLVDRVGLVVASFVCLFLVCYQRWRTNPLEILVIFVCLTVFNYVVFIFFLGMAMPVFWWDT